MHAAHPGAAGGGGEGDDHLAGTLRHGGVHDALEPVGEGVPIGGRRGAPQVEVDEHVEAVVEVVDDPRDRLRRTFEVVGIDVRADHAGA